ncbi:uncharacterized protein LOC129219880 [Uloborus diversus]|uniref:uncharacterized protein LOC129219880 n=1 Tax=Uloborus diversus TaxID=327109 RepID=UPI00240A6756|nr:uncharacterized protein LOC129219880 [Uloborus diversus]
MNDRFSSAYHKYVGTLCSGYQNRVGMKCCSQGARSCGQERRRPEAAPASKGLSSEFAFDNPYFRDQENDQDTEKGKMRSSMNKNSLRSSKVSDFSSNKTKKSRSGKNPFTFSGGASKKQRALDDSCLQVEPERTVVSLRGHDFTGLGFNICGNMRDGILVKDVLHRGPASESGLIKAGDKIISVTVSFTNIVYEDALTILSYASPYDVQLELERVPDKTRALPNTPSGTKRPLGSCSFNRSGQKLFHPLYRSQSIDDLTQIDRDSSLPPTLGLGPRRSQSVGVAAHKLAAHFKNSDSKLTDDKTGVSSNQMVLSTTGSLNEKMLANVMADGSPHWKKRFEDTLEGDTVEVLNQSSTSSEQRKDSTPDVEKKSSDGPTSQTYMKKNMKYLDSPHNKGKLQTYKSPADKDRDVSSQKAEHSRRAKTMAEASSALWQLDQSIQDGEGSDIESSKSSNWNPDNGIVSKSGRFSHKEDEIESDVSHDSLELSNKKTSGKKSKKHTSASHSRDCAIESETLEDMKQSCSSSANKQNIQQKSSKKSSHHSENNKSKGHATDMGTKNEHSRNAERVYANNILNKVGGQSSADYSERSKDNPKTITDAREAKGFESVPSVVYANHREMQEKVVVVGRAAQKTASSDPANNYGKVNGRAGHSERQKLSGTENFSPNYGSSRIVINGETDEMKNRFASNSKSNYPNQSRDSPVNYPKQDGVKSDEVMRWMENKQKSNLNQKFSKSSASPAGMFTQINPFQQPSRHKNANFKIWSGREELSANGNDSQYTSSLSNSYGSDSPVQTNRRENMPENQPYVSKTVLISPYETSSRNGVPNSSQILNYRQQH